MANQTAECTRLEASDDAGTKEAPAKRQKVADSTPDDTDTHPSASSTTAIQCSKGRLSDGGAPKEYVLQLPPRLTKSAYQTLLACNVAPRQWHLEGRFGSRTHKIDKSTNGIPILYSQTMMEKIAQASTELKELLATEGVSVVEEDFVHNHRTKQEVPEIDARMHPELEPENFVLPKITAKQCLEANNVNKPTTASSFTYAEMFGGIGGFGVGLHRLGGKCVFYSEIDERCRETYALNFDTPSTCIHGDIYEAKDEDFPQNLDLLVAGFPCQPFSTLGQQPGFDCEKGRGHLYVQIVRALELSKPKAFLFENVQGLMGMKDTLDVIVTAFRGAGYKVTAEVCSARGLTATGRKRLFFVGVRKDLVTAEESTSSNNQLAPEKASPSPFDNSFFQFPYVPDLKICSHDILDYDSLPTSELDVLRLSEATLGQLSKSKKWKPSDLAWPNKQCNTLTSHYGNAVGRGESQLVPCSAPHPPRRFSVRECARIMGFPNNFKFSAIRPDQGEMAHKKAGYRMVGNAVCPPLIAALAGSVLNAAGVEFGSEDVQPEDTDWTQKGRRAAMDLACSALRPEPLPLPAGCLLAGNPDTKE